MITRSYLFYTRLIHYFFRAADKVPFFTALRKYRDFLNGNGPEPQEEEIVFANVVLKAWPKKAKKENNLEEIQENCNRRETEACEQTDVPDYYSPSTNYSNLKFL